MPTFSIHPLGTIYQQTPLTSPEILESSISNSSLYVDVPVLKTEPYSEKPKTLGELAFKKSLFSKLTPEIFHAGIEYEIEGVELGSDNFGHLIERLSLISKEDLSLKYYGVEIITPPWDYEYHKKIYGQLMGGLPFVTEDANIIFSERTSTHVHVNCLGLTRPQIRAGIFLYIFLEPLFFTLVEEKRKHNIHCVPIGDTVLFDCMTMNPVDSLNDILSHWAKYAALNALPLKNLGTLEFRHFGGARNWESLSRWLLVLQEWYRLIHSEEVTLERIQKVLQERAPFAVQMKLLCPTMMQFFDWKDIHNSELHYVNQINLKLCYLNTKIGK